MDEHPTSPPKPDAGRRTLLRASLAATAAPLVLTSRTAQAQVTPLPPSPPTTPWIEDLPTQITPLAPVSAPLYPWPTLASNYLGGECGRGEHQRYDELTAPLSGVVGTPVQYQLTAKENAAWLYNGTNPYYPPQPIWGYQGNGPAATSPGPTFFMRYGQSVLLRVRNELPTLHTGFGSPEISTHLHNMHTPSESDGFAGDFYSVAKGGPTLTGGGQFNDHFYPNAYAGIDEFGGIGDSREALGTLFYHDHTEGFTAPNVLKGLFGSCFMFDDLDSGSEQTGLRLPSWPYDYPLAFSDKRFDSGGRLTFDELAPEGVLGDKVVVNGKIEPVLRVARRKYRLRLLNVGPTRYYEFYLQNGARTTVYPYSHIANDGNLLPNPITGFKVRLAPAERADIVIDFSRFALHTELYLVNQLLQTQTRRPDAVKAPGTQLLKFVVDRNPPAPDTSVVPSALRPLRPLPSAAELAALPVRRWNFERSSGMWTVNGQFFNVFSPRATVAKGAAEIWEFVNLDNGWQHPIHVHFEEGRILSKTFRGAAVAVPVHERGRKDVFNLGELMTMRVLFRFRDFTGKYLLHCHNLTHEDHAMMVRFDIT